MHDGKALQTPAPELRGNPISRIRKILLRRLWLPKFVYESLPYLYILCGMAALASALYTPDWTWILPWAVLIGLICLHAGLAVVALRYRVRCKHDAAD
jgi:hypothetical protein